MPSVVLREYVHVQPEGLRLPRLLVIAAGAPGYSPSDLRDNSTRAWFTGDWAAPFTVKPVRTVDRPTVWAVSTTTRYGHRVTPPAGVHQARPAWRLPDSTTASRGPGSGCRVVV